LSQSPVLSQTRIRVQFAHGLESSPAGSKARHLAEHFDTITPEMDTGDFEACVAVHAAALQSFRPELLVGSSFGGAVAVELLRRALWRGPTLLLAQAALRRRPDARLPESVAVWLVHGLRDELIDAEDSRRLAATGSPDFVRLVLVDDDHRLARSVAEGRLVEWVRELAAWRPRLR
jgi:pimeloyl-ACP methyl ester carboxylesterase